MTGVERYARRLIEAFGPRRVMWESDWPVCTLAASYAGALELGQRAIAELGEAHQAAVLGGTATRVHGL
jgi:L-fuconolactonase